MIKVSVIVPVYKVPLDFLRECLDSLVAQTLLECEFILVSDGAPDAECAICDEYVAKDSRFKFFRREHAGVSATRNFGIEQAQGEFITFVDSDDWIDKNNLDEVYSFAIQNNSDIVLWEAVQHKVNCDCTEFFSHVSINKLSEDQVHEICQNTIFTSSFKYNGLSLVCCKLFRKKLIQLNNIKYPEDIHLSEDRVFNITAFKKAGIISYLRKTFYYYRIHSSSASHKFIPNAFNEYIKFLTKFDHNEQEIYKVAISNEYIRSFFLSWSSYYFHPLNKNNYSSSLKELKRIIKSDVFQEKLKLFSAEYFSFLIKLETILFKLKSSVPLYLHYIKAVL